jgi:HPr kinase/phosphorylase
MAAVTASPIDRRKPETVPGTSFVHGTAALIGETGVLIRGPSGAGKSVLCLSLLEEAMRLGLFARLVADDCVALMAYGDRLVARPHAAIAGQVERRGQGISAIPHEAAAVIRLVIDLEQRDKTPRLPSQVDRTTIVQGLSCPRLCLPRESSPVENAQAVLAFLRQARSLASV